MVRVMSNPRYRGKHVVVVAGKVYTATSGAKANKLLDKLEREYPKETPAITYIPKSDTLGFLNRDDVPPLLGRHQFFETFLTTFSPKYRVTFSEEK